jgi:hypothetical protein
MDWCFAMKVVYVEWIDAVADSGWDAFDKAEPVHYCRTIGYLVKETNDGLCIASTVSDKECNARITIPKAWIKKRKTVAVNGQKK